MRSGSIALANIQQADGQSKVRPVVVLQKMPPFDDILVCAVSSQLRHECPRLDEVISATDDDFISSGLKTTSLIRLGLVATIPQKAVIGELGSISAQRLDRIRSRLANHIRT